MKYSCRNCCNFKSKVVRKTDLKKISKNKIQKALKERDPDSLDLMFPFNLTVYKRLLRESACPIFYCSERLFNRDLYIQRENMDIDDFYPFKTKPCPRYK